MALLGLDGLKVLIQLIKGSLDKKADKDLATTSTNGLMSSADKTKLDGVATGANNYAHPSYTAKESGLYKTTIDNTGHVSAATAVAKSDITGLGIPSSDTTYSTATTSANGLMSSADKTKLDGVETGANNYVHPTDGGNYHLPSGSGNSMYLKGKGGGTPQGEWTTPLAGINNSSGDTLPTANAVYKLVNNRYYVCDTVANSQTKIISAPDSSYGSAARASGNVIAVKFTNGSSSSTSMYIQTDFAVKVWCNNSATIPAIKAGTIVQFVYSSDTTYPGWHMINSHPTGSGNYHLPSGGTMYNYLSALGDGTGRWLSAVDAGEISSGNSAIPSAGGVYDFVNDNYAKQTDLDDYAPLSNLGTIQILGYEYVTVTYSTMIADGASASASASFTGFTGATNYVASLVKMSYLNPTGISINSSAKTITVSLLNASGGTHSGNCQYLLTAYKKI